MTKIIDSWQWAFGLIRLHYDVVGIIALICPLVLGVLEYGYLYHKWDLLWWRDLVMQEEITPLSVMLHIAGIKVAVILGLTLWSFTRVGDKTDMQASQDMPISYVRRRYCRFLMMRLLASLDELVSHQHLRMVDFQQMHKDFCMAVELFRWEARKLFERSDLQLCLPLHEVLLVKDLQEEDLLRRGYGERLEHLRELDIHRMVFET
ncbi:uncharacterized protein LOC108047798 [Drosophila rhopaloa]|uniref:Uncharacterized protein LOC108047798 n=1 Tax=Drosophila rhopaloa TaxID=1041015 RepID=A0A6P4F8H3_DRORH|nr:uncharacterized protein LOC108047798 [Drosophila rhopaloa]